MKKSILITIITLLSSLTAIAQYDAMFTQYMFNEMYINPAYAGSKEAMSTTLAHRQQWVNFPGRPITTSFTLHGPLADGKMGLGISFLNEKIGNISYYDSSGQSEYNFNKPYSENTARTIDEEVKKLTDIAYAKTKQILMSNKEKLTLLAEKLLEKEVIFKVDLEDIFGKRPFDKVEENPSITPATEDSNQVL